MSLFDDAFEFTVGHEGGYVNDTDDSGGETNWGISKKAHPDVDIKNLTKDGAKEIYRKNYWNSYYELLNNDTLTIRVFDMAVNSGAIAAIKILQEAINYCGGNIPVDGRIGVKTTNSTVYINKDYLLERFRVERSKYYADCVTNRPTNLKYLKGWIYRNYK
jgi:lysozyme family protein